MRRPLLVILIGTFLILWSLAACVQATPTTAPQPTALPATPVPPSPTAPPAPTALPPTAAPTAAPSATSAPTKTSAPTPVPPTTAPTAAPTKVNLTPLPASVSGIVSGPKGPMAGAVVQVKGTNNKATTAANGSFTLNGIKGTTPITVIAWSQGYFQGWTELNPSAPDWKGGQGFTITLKPLYETDNANYPWFSWEGVKGSASCGLCHREYKEWQADAHSQAAKNPRFLSVYTGSNAKGDPGQPVVFDSKGLPKAPDPAKPYYGVGYRLDNPSRAGNCATCHTPVASKVPNQRNCGWSGCHNDLTIEHSAGIIEPHTLSIVTAGEGTEGVTCDFCHKIGDVLLDPHTNLPKPDMPGILSYRLYRPEDGQQLFFGTMIDINRRVSYSPLMSQGEYCAPCHYGVFGGVVGSGTVTGGTLIYNSYGEWLASPYSNPKAGRTCQDCHMKVLDTQISVFPEAGGIPRDYTKFHEHYMPGASDEKLLKNAVSMNTGVQHLGDQLSVVVSIHNDNTGHHIPTDAPIRSMILVVEALDASGNRLALSQGPVNPAYSGNYAGVPGKTFAKVLKDEWTGETPTTAYWRPVTVVEDTRLPALTKDQTQYLFNLPAGKAAKVSIKLVFRRAFQSIAQQKGWTDPDIVMKSETFQIEK